MGGQEADDMQLTQKMIWKIYAGVLGAVTTIAAQKLVTKLWEASTGEAPPDPNDPDTPMSQALIWALASGLGVGVAQLTMNRYMSRHWVKATGAKAPGRLFNKLD